ncbi:major facilitator superfamily domain-containing protein [Cercophora scortea]|uniref:Major facilitator superfamily domain-containing protein n=1 Tax=Cercophora scortea TaxID=314031 RepID=A0AAE0IWJ8_9PEZI|nr:major facilitator superfamily domain-containing protein [Cercophora scortea]
MDQETTTNKPAHSVDVADATARGSSSDSSNNNESNGNGNQTLASWQLVTVMASLCVGIFLFGLDVNIIGVAIPHITTEFSSLPDVAWYGAAYLLTLTAFQPLFGNLYKFFNAKIVYLVSLILFEVGSAISAAAPGSSVLIFGRAFLGLGAAGLLQGALAIIGKIVTVDKVPVFQSIVISSLVISVCIGPVIGGALTDNVPAGYLVAIVIFFFVPRTGSSNTTNARLPLRQKLHHMDPPGLVVFLGLLVRRGDSALIPLRVLGKRSIYVGALVLTGFGILSVTYGYYLPILFQSVQGVSTTESGVRYIALVGSQIVTTIIVGGLVTTFGIYVPYMIAGGVVCSVGAGLLTTVDLFTSTPQWAAYLVITGLGLGMAMQLPYTALQAVLDPVDVATGNAIAVFSFHLAGALGTAIAQNLLLDGLYVYVPQYTSEVDPSDVIRAGAQGLTMLAGSSDEILEALRLAYGQAVHRTVILGLAGACFATCASPFMEWVNIKRVADARTQKNNEPRLAVVEGVEGGSGLVAMGGGAPEKKMCGKVHVVTPLNVEGGRER